ncbi:hypothetical protein [Pelagibius marinus]|uniref:hypothetical protein n=1 Tax=Pelagibius marinus TaxID=2762760 RepID=UPI001872FD43|nr:hypothetical protein [Pelagibius marinus]
MFKADTVFVVGAGASSEVKLPLGSQLKSRIADAIDIKFGRDHQETGSPEIMDALRVHANFVRNTTPSWVDVNHYLHAGWRIRDAMPQASSIDTFIDAHSGNEAIELCGKLAISHTILNAEKASLLYVDQRMRKDHFDFKSVEKTWLSRFFQALTTGCSKDQLPSIFDQVAFVTFNYDRCIEHFLYHSLQNFYGVAAEEAAELVNSLRIYHPYGQVGRLPWQNELSPVPFGASCGGSDLLTISSQIKTFTEQVDDEDSLGAAHEAITKADQVAFLGFAFHDQNMELLNPGTETSARRILATGKGLSGTDCDMVQSELKRAFEKADGSVPFIHVGQNLTCVDLFDEFLRTLLSA